MNLIKVKYHFFCLTLLNAGLVIYIYCHAWYQTSLFPNAPSLSPGETMTGLTFLGRDIDLDCNCGMGAKCLLVRRKHEKAQTVQGPFVHSQDSSSRSLYNFNKEQTKMSKWNNIADLTQHRETIKVQ